MESKEHSIAEGDMPVLNDLSLWGSIAAMVLSDKGGYSSGFNEEVTFTQRLSDSAVDGYQGFPALMQEERGTIVSDVSFRFC